MTQSGNSLEVPWSGLCTFTAEGMGSIPAWGTKSLQALQCGQKQTNKTKTKTKHKDPEECLETSQGESSTER